ncbi:alanine--tRNA ligase-related protein [Umezawaea sp. Da 62-37]|uniref:alanine--tRNA ligase-related protein n=1 Tax=Umezawaea sp. Da 62-37 TaxID=3075927 RepID=UPI0028F6EA6B|nr:alanine--tRNA ligase-related protein [Umezawaea sp. Da 62-37]WNV88504.1 alanine--tRNA ligase-related protein [Umezawaea sp. Da 62-37]
MDTQDVINTFVDFFTSRGHRRITGSSLLPPPGDPVLFTTSGMHPLTPFLEGRPHPLGGRLVNVQRCLRTTDLDEVGDPSHLTVFEMLGSWSLRSYDGPQSLRWGYELLRDGFGVDPGLLHVTVFGGDDQVGPDVGSLETWRSLDVPVELTGTENWWSNGPTGPCGPDSEMFVWTGDGPPTGTPTTDGQWMEVWNHVMMRYRRHGDGSLTPLSESTVDTGMGLERLLMLLQGKRSVFETDLLSPWVDGLPWDVSEPRLVVDHLRSSVVVIGDGVTPSNTGRGYVLRRLLRRTLTMIWREDDSRTLSDVPESLVRSTSTHFDQGGDRVFDVLGEEERRFRSLVTRGRDLVSRYPDPLTERDFRYLHETHGLPRDLVVLLRDL